MLRSLATRHTAAVRNVASSSRLAAAAPAATSAFSTSSRAALASPAPEKAPKKMVKLTIDGKEVEVEQGTALIQACEIAGAQIPRFCYHERLLIAGEYAGHTFAAYTRRS